MDTNLSHTSVDKSLVASVLGGNTQAFGDIIRNTEKLVAQIIFKMIPHAEDRRDLAQDVYLKVFKSLPHFRFQAKLSTWIGQITFNTCVSHLEKKKLFFPDTLYGETEGGEDPMESIGGGRPGSLAGGADSQLLEKERSTIIQGGIDQLPPVYRTLITLYHQEELSYAEIATITELPEGTVKSYLFRARRCLKETLLGKFKKEEL